VPAGNGVAASVLCRLGLILGELSYVDAAERVLQAAWNGIRDYPQAHMSLINALEDFLAPPQILVIRGDADGARAWAREFGAAYAPTRAIFAIPSGAAGLPPALAAKEALDGTVAYLCTGMTCSAPLQDRRQIAGALAPTTSGRA
jgi:hypothetical protein